MEITPAQQSLVMKLVQVAKGEEPESALHKLKDKLILALGVALGATFILGFALGALAAR